MKTTLYYWKQPEDNHFTGKDFSEPGHAGELQLRPDERILWASAPGSVVLRWGGLVLWGVSAMALVGTHWVYTTSYEPGDPNGIISLLVILSILAAGCFAAPLVGRLLLKRTKYFITTKRVVIDRLWNDSRLELDGETLTKAHLRVVGRLWQPCGKWDVCIFKEVPGYYSKDPARYVDLEFLSVDQVREVEEALSKMEIPATP